MYPRGDLRLNLNDSSASGAVRGSGVSTEIEFHAVERRYAGTLISGLVIQLAPLNFVEGREGKEGYELDRRTRK